MRRRTAHDVMPVSGLETFSPTTTAVAPAQGSGPSRSTWTERTRAATSTSTATRRGEVRTVPVLYLDPGVAADLADLALRLPQIIKEFGDLGRPTPAASTTKSLHISYLK